MADQVAEYQDSGANGEQYAEQADTNNGDDFSGGNDGDKINATRNSNDEKKIFVGGLSWETTVKDMREYFEKFGAIEDCTLKTDPQSGRSRGFGFVQFKEAGTVDAVLAQATHTLHGRNIDPKRAKARGGREPIKKVFVGGLDPEVPEADIKAHFEQFGKIEEIDLPFDKQKNQRRAFCFITFETEEIVDNVVQETKQTVNGKEVDVKKATPKGEQYGGYGNYAGPGRRGGFRGGRGGRGGYNQGWGNYDYNNYYGNSYGGYGGYGGGYDNYYNYDYNNYYGQGGWGNQGGYGSGGYGGNYGGNQQGQNSQQYKQKSARGGGQQSSGYHPYQR